MTWWCQWEGYSDWYLSMIMPFHIPVFRVQILLLISREGLCICKCAHLKRKVFLYHILNIGRATYSLCFFCPAVINRNWQFRKTTLSTLVKMVKWIDSTIIFLTLIQKRKGQGYHVKTVQSGIMLLLSAHALIE